MTDQPAPTQDLTAYQVVTEPDTRLEQLHASYAMAKAEADKAAEALKAITDAIKLEMTQQAPEGSSKITLLGEHGPALQLTYSESWRIDTARLKRETPETYVRYAKKGGSWSLRQVGGGEA